MLWICVECTTRYAEGLDRCPHCSATGFYLEGSEQDMPKNTVHEGPSNADAGLTPEPVETPEETPEADTDTEVEADTEPEAGDSGPVGVGSGGAHDAMISVVEGQADGDEAGGDTSQSGSDDGGPARPAGNASTQAWADYVTALGGSFPEDATRAELIDQADRLRPPEAE